MLIIFAVLAFLVSTVWFAVQRAWPLALLALGLTLVTLARFGPIQIG